MAAEQPTGQAHSTRERHALLGIYLNDHLAGSSAGLEFARRIARAEHGTATGVALERLAGEIAEDRQALLDIMAALDIGVSQVKVALGWAAEKVGRLKLNGHLVSRSPLSTLIELEVLQLGVEGKAAGWRTLRSAADREPRLDAARLDDLLVRARRQADTLEELRVQTAGQLFA